MHQKYEMTEAPIILLVDLAIALDMLMDIIVLVVIRLVLQHELRFEEMVIEQ